MPVLEYIVDGSITQKLLEENVNLQSLKLWLPQEGFGVVLRVVEVDKLFGEVTIIFSYLPLLLR